MAQTNSANIVIAGNVLPILQETLAQNGQVQQFLDPAGKDRVAFEASLTTTDALLATSAITVNEALLAKAPNLKVISQPSVGVDNIDLDACTAHKIPVGHTPGVLVEATADLAFGLLLSAARRIPAGWNFVKSGAWGEKQSFALGVDLYGKTLGIVGMGRIGSAVVRRAQASGMKVIYHNRHRHPDEAALKADYVSFDQLLASADFVLLLLPLTKESEGLFNRETFAKMKPSAYLINIARGKIVDSEALYDALTTGKIAFAALDVTDPEPLPGDHKLLSLDNILVSPHIGSATKETRHAMALLAAENLLSGLADKALPACANSAANYK
ncbi:MAG: D-glycerate dehydrogenase [Sporomusaceae bacterium]|nr:D-glycerate dehydrogenase [Sporomusaceae bacterium]